MNFQKRLSLYSLMELAEVSPEMWLKELNQYELHFNVTRDQEWTHKLNFFNQISRKNCFSTNSANQTTLTFIQSM